MLRKSVVVVEVHIMYVFEMWGVKLADKQHYAAGCGSLLPSSLRLAFPRLKAGKPRPKRTIVRGSETRSCNEPLGNQLQQPRGSSVPARMYSEQITRAFILYSPSPHSDDVGLTFAPPSPLSGRYATSHVENMSACKLQTQTLDPGRSMRAERGNYRHYHHDT